MEESDFDAESDLEVAIKVYHTCGGERWRNTSGWLTAAKPGSWYGLTLNQMHGSPHEGRLIGIQLRGNLVCGRLISELGKLKQLEWLLLANNPGLVGEIPPELGYLKELRQLDFHNCTEITGVIPDTLGRCTKLTHLSFHECRKLTGIIPESLTQLCELQELDLYNCLSLTGGLPDGMRTLSKLSRLIMRSGQACSVSGAVLDSGGLFSSAAGFFSCDIQRTNMKCVTYDPAEVFERMQQKKKEKRELEERLNQLRQQQLRETSSIHSGEVVPARPESDPPGLLVLPQQSS